MEIRRDQGSEPLLPIPVSTSSNSTLDHGDSTSSSYSWLFQCHGFWYKLFLIVPSLLFVLYLAFRAKKSLSKLSNGRSYIIVAYYGTLWIVTLLNFAWCLFQVRFLNNFFKCKLFVSVFSVSGLSFSWG